MKRLNRLDIVMVLGVSLLAVPRANAQLLSTFRDNVLVPMANNQPFPQGLFQTAMPTPFSNTTVGGGTTLATAYLQSISVQSLNPINFGPVPSFSTHVVTETASQGIYTEPSEGVFDIMDPILTASLAIGAPLGNLPAVWQLNIVDADGNAGNGPTPFVNDFLPEAPLGSPVAVYQSPGPIPVALVSPMGRIIATNTMTGFQFTSVDPMAPPDPLLNNMFGIYLSDWTMLEMDVDGTSSPFLMEWMNMPQIRWKAHMRGGPPVAVVVGMGPAALWHGPFVPEPACGWLALTMGATCIVTRRRGMSRMCSHDGHSL